MKIGIIGSGSVGTALATLLKMHLGKISGDGKHDLRIGSRKDPSNQPLDVVHHGEVVVLAIPYTAVQDFVKSSSSIEDAFKGKVVVDATNPLGNDWSPLVLGAETSGAEEIAKLLPESKVVKAFNTIFADVMKPEIVRGTASRVTAFVASDHGEAVDMVAELAADCGFEAVTITKLSAARYLEAMAHLNIELAVGEGGGTGAFFGYHRLPADAEENK